MFGQKCRLPMYGLLNLCIACGTFALAQALFRWQIAHTAFLVVQFIVYTWDGGSFYVEVFSVRYRPAEKRSASDGLDVLASHINVPSTLPFAHKSKIKVGGDDGGDHEVVEAVESA